MPPKRKRAEEGTTGEAAESAAAPRRSNRSKATTADPAPAKTTTKKTTKAPAASAVTGDEPASKRKKSTKVETADKPPAKRGRKKADAGDAEPAPSTTKAPAATKPSAKEPVPEAVAKPPSPIKAKTKPTKNEPYTPKRAQDLFSQYADSDDPNVIGPEGFEQLFTEADIPMDGALPLLLAWQMEAKEMAKISKEEWTKGTESLKIASLGSLSIALDDLENLLVSAKPPLKRSAKPDQDPYDRTLYFQHANDVDSAFSKFYSYCFSLAKPEGSRNIDMETSAAFWTVLLTKRYPIMLEVVEFINDKKDTYRATNKDLWSMMLEFCQTVKPTLEDYEADGAWPTLLDDFAQWKKTNKGANPNGA